MLINYNESDFLTARIHPEHDSIEGIKRGSFQRDRDRIMYSRAFR